MTSALRGLLGGTFDPIHVGHLRLALEVADLAGLSQVHLIPSATPPHRPPPETGAAHRLALVRAAVAGDARLLADDRELRRSGPSYTVDTLADLQVAYPDAHWCLILGADALAGLAGWHRYRDLIGLAHLVVAQRPGTQRTLTGELAEVLGDRLTRDPAVLHRTRAGAVLLAEVPALEVSASRIRALLRAGRSVRHLLPDACLSYIESHCLYRPEGDRAANRIG